MGRTAEVGRVGGRMRKMVGASAPLVHKVASTRAFAKVAPPVLPVFDRLVHRLTGGRTLASSGLLPVLLLTTTGARSGRERVTPLVCVAEESGSFLVVGSNFGKPEHPAWTGNLIKHPEARVSHRGRYTAVSALLLEGEERERAWAAVLAVWPPYDAYQARVERRIRVFRLVPR